MNAVSERLVQQLVKMRQREEELDRERTMLSEKDALKASLLERLQQLKEQVMKVESVRSTLEKLNLEAEEKYAEARRDDELEREKLSRTLKEAINVVNSYSEEVVQLEVKAESENRSLKEQKEIYTKYHTSGKDKYDEIMKARETEYAKIKDKCATAAERKPVLEQELAEVTATAEIARAEYARLQQQVNEWVGRLSEVHQKLLKARGSFETAKDEKERQLCRIRSLESDRQVMLSRAEKSKIERDKERAKVIDVEKKIETIKKQTDKLLALAAMFEDGCASGSGG